MRPSICSTCGQYRTDSENWAPYRALWSRLGGRPWTHVLREHPLKFAAAVALAFAAATIGKGRAWAAALAFLAGLMAGHVLW